MSEKKYSNASTLTHPASLISHPSHTFLGSEMPNTPLEQARFVVLPVPYEKTTSYKKGTFRGPEALLAASSQLEVWDEELKKETWKGGIHTLPFFTSEEPAEKFFPRLQAKVTELAKLKDKKLFIVGGEHSLSQATIPAYARLYPDLSVLHFDAHADLREEYEGTPYNHACALYPASRLCPVVQVGIRSVGSEELHNMNSGRVKTFFMQENKNLKSLIQKTLKSLTKNVFISIDLDGFDPSVIPGVGTPQPGGFSWEEGLQLFRGVIEKKNVVGVDLMELCPLQDNVISEFAAAKLAYRLMGYLSLKNFIR
ncbi:MAG: agmatinase [Elusimicrobia bacterium]|nr:agmatinase [Elusimicrobiota bacterium]